MRTVQIKYAFNPENQKEVVEDGYTESIITGFEIKKIPFENTSGLLSGTEYQIKFQSSQEIPKEVFADITKTIIETAFEKQSDAPH